jgi:hypothetical protein
MKFEAVPAAAPTVTGAASCGPGEVTLGSGGNYRWYTTLTGGTAIADQTASAFTTPRLTGTTTYYVSIVNGKCESARTAVTAIIHTAPEPPSVATAVSFCQGSTASTLTAKGTNLNWYTTATDAIPLAMPPIPNTATVGTIDYYVSQTVDGCESKRAKTTVTVNVLPSISAGEEQTVCVMDETFALPGFSQVGGTWSGNGISTLGEFTPVAAGVGAHTLTYSYTQNGCTFTATKVITVMAVPTVTLASFTDMVCSGNNTFVLTGGQPAGGTYSGNGVSNGIFNAAVAGKGTHTITYTYPTNGCTAIATQDIAVATCTESEIALATVIYPNPATDKVTIRVPLTGKNNISVKILNGQGKIVEAQYYEQVSEEFSKTFDLKVRSKGIYLLYLTTDKETITKRITLQ